MSDIICLYGPTAAGKTALAIELVERLDGEIISVDSALIYRGMDIGTAKPSAAELARAPHRLINICDPLERYSAAQFVADAKREINAVRARGKRPILVGGTMLYFKALLEGFSELPEASSEVRAKLQKQLKQDGLSSLHQQLSEIDPTSGARIHPNDPQRIMRALEVYLSSGRTLTECQRSREGAWDEPIYQFAITPSARPLLHDRIAERFRIMLDQGFLMEVEALRARGDLHLDLPSMRCVGYRQAWQYLDDDCSYNEFIDKGVAATRQLAKRQLTWLRGWPDVTWLETGSDDLLKPVMQRLEKPATLLSDHLKTP